MSRGEGQVCGVGEGKEENEGTEGKKRGKERKGRKEER